MVDSVLLVNKIKGVDEVLLYEITEENHGSIGIEESFEDCIYFLISSNWLHGLTDFNIWGEWVTLSELLKINGIENPTNKDVAEHLSQYKETDFLNSAGFYISTSETHEPSSWNDEFKNQLFD